MAYKVLGPGILGLSEFQKLVCWSFGGRVGRILGYEGGWDLPTQGEILAPPWLWTSRLVCQRPLDTAGLYLGHLGLPQS